MGLQFYVPEAENQSPTGITGISRFSETEADERALQMRLRKSRPPPPLPRNILGLDPRSRISMGHEWGQPKKSAPGSIHGGIDNIANRASMEGSHLIGYRLEWPEAEINIGSYCPPPSVAIVVHPSPCRIAGNSKVCTLGQNPLLDRMSLNT